MFPRIKVSKLMMLIDYILTRFEIIKMSVRATGGEVSKAGHKDKVKEISNQLGVEMKGARIVRNPNNLLGPKEHLRCRDCSSA